MSEQSLQITIILISGVLGLKSVPAAINDNSFKWDTRPEQSMHMSGRCSVLIFQLKH